MSEDSNSPLEFSAFDLMPDWAQETNDSDKKPEKRFDHDKYDNDRGGKGRRGGGGNFERRGGPRDNNRRGGGGDRDRRGGGGGFRGGGDRDGRRGGGDRRDRRGGGGGRNQGHGRGGRQFDQNENFEIKGLKMTFEPTPEAAKSLSKHIVESAKAYPVADLAKMIANARERYQIRLKSEKDGPKIYQIKQDGSAFLSRDEAISGFLDDPELVGKYYKTEEVALDAPKGNFSTIAVCGFSGEILGPPNHHEYQGTVARLHREKFANMSIERYKQRIQMESGEEILEKWQEKVSKTHHFRVKTGEEEAEAVVEEEAAPEEGAPEEPVAKEPEAEEAPAEVVEAEEETAEATEEQPEAAEETAEPEAEAEETPADPEPEPEPVATEEPKADEVVLKNRTELEMHFRQNFADAEISEAGNVVLPGNISGKKLSRDILSLLKSESRKLRRGFPFEMFQSVCSCLEKEGLKFFKRGKKALHVSMVRPQALSENVQLTDRVQKIVELIKESPKIQTMDVLEKLCADFKRPDKDDKEAKPALTDEAKGILTDIRWLATEGYIVEFPDTKLEIGKIVRPGAEQAQKPSKKKKAKEKKSDLPGGICTFTVVE